MLHGSHAADHDGHGPSVLRSAPPRGVRADRVLGPVSQHGEHRRSADRRADHERACLSSGPTGPHAERGRAPPAQSCKGAQHGIHGDAEEGPAQIPGTACRRSGGSPEPGSHTADWILLMNGICTVVVGDERAVASAPCGALNRYPFFAYRIWFGMRVAVLLSLLTRNHFAVSPARIAFVFRGFVCSLVNSGGNIVQRLIFGKRVRECVLDAQPIFIIGHWRTG